MSLEVGNEHEATLSTSSPPMDASELDLSKDDVDHHAELVKADAESLSNSSMS